MKLTVREAAGLLSVKESELYRWVEDGEVPFYMVNHQPLFSRPELLEWAMARHLPLSPALFEEGARTIHLADALAAGGVHHGVPGADRAAVLRAVVDRLPIVDEDDRAMVLAIMSAREAHVSTGVGGGIAIPHVRAPMVFAGAAAAISLCFLEHAVPFDAIDGAPVQIVFAMITPTIKSHLQLLSRLSFALHDAAFKQALARRASRDEILAAARSLDAALATPKADDDRGNGDGAAE